MRYLNDAGGRFKLPLKDAAGKTLCTLLWGDLMQGRVRLASVILSHPDADHYGGSAAGLRGAAEPRPLFAPAQLEARFDASATGRYRRLTWLPMATDLVYGLVNVRSDGQRILCATMKEGSSDFELQVFQAGVEAV